MAKSAEPSLFQAAEWTPHAAVWTAWPRVPDYWSGAMEGARREMAAFFHAITDPDPTTGQPRGETVRVLVRGEEATTSAKKWLSAPGIELITAPYGDVWLRDTGPIIVRRGDAALQAVGFGYNGWGGKYIMEGDEKTAAAVAAHEGLSFISADWVLEGGSIDVDGEGSALTTRQCLLNPNRNPDLSEADIAKRLRESLGIRHLIWLEDGLLNDHTDGHIDNIARFVAPGKVVCMAPSGKNDPNAATLDRIARALEDARDVFGRRLEVIRIPSPGRLTDTDGEPIPASYMNFYISNTRVLVPVYGSEQDANAVDAIGRLFPTRAAIGLRADNILVGGGSFHCITQQIPV